jgi:small-conductance mechanosensitive channel
VLRLGCAIVALVLAPLAHPRAAPPDEKRAPISVAPPSDAAIASRIEGLVGALGGMEELEVEVRSGIVRLRGRADSLAVREQALGLAERVEGVVLVRNEVDVAADVRGRLGPTWARLRRYLGVALGFLPVLAVALAAFSAFALLASAVGRFRRPFERLGLSLLGASMLRVALRATLLVAGVVVALELLGLVALVGTVVGALGLIGIVAGIAFRDVVANYLPGVMLGLNPPFGPGDHVQIGEHEGRVVRVTSRETILVAHDGQHLRIPNVRLLQEAIVNFERHRERRLHFPLEVALAADLRQVQDVGRETLLSLPGLEREPPPFMRVLGVEADHVRIAFYAWVDQKTSSFADAASRARQDVTQALLSAGVPFPTHEITVHPPRGEAADRSLGAEEPDAREEALLDAHLRVERRAPGERDLLREGRSRPA